MPGNVLVKSRGVEKEFREARDRNAGGAAGYRREPSAGAAASQARSRFKAAVASSEESS